MLNVNNLTGFGVSGGGDSGFSELFKIKAVDYVAVAIATKKYKLVTMTRPDYSTARNGNEVIIGTAGDNSIGVFLSNNDYVIAGGAGNDSINLDYTRGNVIAMGDAGNNHVYGSSFTGKIFLFSLCRLAQLQLINMVTLAFHAILAPTMLETMAVSAPVPSKLDAENPSSMIQK